LVGDEDEFISEKLKEEVMKSLDNAGLTFSHIFYKGGHAIVTEPLLQLSKRLTEQ
jgi:predicted esterase